MELSEKKCKPCEGGVKPYTEKEANDELKNLDEWSIKEGKLAKDFSFSNFKEALAFVNKVGEIAEEEQHHPNIEFTWGECKIRIYTHEINGLSENDFILAAKIDKLDS